MRKRKPNIADSLVKKSLEAFIISIELHNKPNFAYRYQSCSILLSHSWELLLKAYSYKYLKNKNVLEKDDDWNYQTFTQILNKIFHSNSSDFRILNDTLETLNDYRNIIIHWYISEDLWQLVYEVISKCVLLYRDFVDEFFPKFSLDWIEETFILPISFKLPLTSIDILTRNYSSENTSKDVIEFIQKLNSRIERLSADWIEENIFIWIKTEFVNRNNMNNTNIVASINQNSEIAVPFQRETQVRLVNDPSIQAIRWLLTEEERLKNFPIATKKELTDIVKQRTWIKWSEKKWQIFFNRIAKELEEQTRWEHWYPNTNNWAKSYSEIFLQKILEYYE